MRNALAAALLAATALLPLVSGGTVPPPICTPIVAAPPVPTSLLIPGPYPTTVPGPCGPGSDLVVSTTAACPAIPPLPGSVILAGEYCGHMYLPGQLVTVTATAAFPVQVTDFRIVMGFDAFPYDGNLNPGETMCISPPSVPAPLTVASTQCAAPLGSPLGSVPLYRLIVWIVPTSQAPMPAAVNFGYTPAGIGTGP